MRIATLFCQEILVDLAVLHDHNEAPGRVLNELDILQRVAIDEQKIGKGTGFDYAQLAGIRIDEPGESEQLAVVSGGHLERLGGRIPTDQFSELGSLPPGKL